MVYVKPAPPVDPALPVGRLESATHAELAAVGREGSIRGIHALVIARQIDQSPPNAVAALSKEYREVLALALEGTKVEYDALDELRARRDAKRAV